MDRACCPPATELARFAVGNLPRSEFLRLAAHVQWCATCEASLQGLDEECDPLLAHLREAAVAGDAAGNTVPEALLAAAQAARGGEPNEPPRRIGKFELREELGLGSFG